MKKYAYEQLKGQYNPRDATTPNNNTSLQATAGDSSSSSKNKDANDDGGPKLVLDGRAIIVRRAVDRDTSRKLAEAGEKRRKDKRNTYLLEEGHVAVGSTAAEGEILY